MKVKVINQEREPIMLEDGTQVGAAYTPEGTVTVELSEADRDRYVKTNRLVVVEAEPLKGTAAAPEIRPEAEPAGKTDRRTK